VDIAITLKHFSKIRIMASSIAVLGST